MEYFIWKGEVRAHEIDAQGIVNNAHYLSYFDHARTLYLKEFGVDWVALSGKGLNLVLVRSDIEFKHPLRPFDTFEITSTARQEGRLKLVFNQRIINSEKKLVCTGLNTVVCVDIERNLPVALHQVLPNFQTT